MSDDAEGAHVGLEPGEFVADAEVSEQLSSGAGITVFRAIREDGTEATVVAPMTGVSQETSDRFISASSELTSRLTTHVENVAIPTAIDPVASAVVLDFSAVGTMADLPTLEWDDARKLMFFEQLAQAVANLHREGLVHGCLCPEVILLDAAYNPCVANVQGIDIAAEYREASTVKEALAPYAAPELRYGKNPTTQSDVFSLGRMMHFLLQGDTPNEPDQAIPTLESLNDAPPGLVCIIRQCTVNDFNDRYWDASNLAEEFQKYHDDEPVGLRLKDPNEKTGPRVAKRDEAAERVLRKDKLREEGGAAAQRRASFAPGKKKKKGGFNVGLAILGVLLCAACVGGAVAGARFTQPALHWLILTLVGALFLPLIVPGGQKGTLQMRLGVVVIAVAILVFVDPTGALEKPQPAPLNRLDGATVGERVAALKAMRADGETFFMQNDFGGGDLSGLDLSGAQLDGSILSNVKAVGTNLSNASLINCDVGGADFSGADLSGVVPEFMKRWPEAKCDDQTRMPTGWACKKGQPTAVETKDDDKK